MLTVSLLNFNWPKKWLQLTQGPPAGLWGRCRLTMQWVPLPLQPRSAANHELAHVPESQLGIQLEMRMSQGCEAETTLGFQVRPGSGTWQNTWDSLGPEWAVLGPCLERLLHAKNTSGCRKRRHMQKFTVTHGGTLLRRRAEAMYGMDNWDASCGEI